MGVTVDLYSWPEIVLAPGQDVTFVHWVVDNNGFSVIDPDRWCMMSAVPEFAGARPDRPLAAAAIEIVIQGATRDAVPEPGPNNTNWLVTWRNPNQSESVTFHPRMVAAPAR